MNIDRMKTLVAIVIVFGTVALLLQFPIQRAEAATVTWDGGGNGGSWEDPLNWDGDTVPTSTDNIIIDGNGISNARVNINQFFQLNDTGSITITSGDIVDVGSLEPLINFGTINNDGNFVGFGLTNEGIVNNNATMAFDDTINNGTINNFGIIISSDDGIFTNHGTINNYGTIDNTEGIIDNTDGTINNFCGASVLNPDFVQGNPVVNVPCATIEGLLDDINSMDISKGLKASLSAPLNRALALLNDDNPDNDSAACGKLNNFIHEVNVKAGKGLTSEQAQELLDEANSIKDALGC